MQCPAKGVPTDLRDDKILERALNVHLERITMGHTAYKAAFEKDGFVVAPEFLLPNILAELKDNLGRHLRDVLPTLSDGYAIMYSVKTCYRSRSDGSIT
jgi:hypothetical protein